MEQFMKEKSKLFSVMTIAVSIFLTVVLAVLFLYAQRSISKLACVAVFAACTLILPRKFSAPAFFRSFSLLLAVLPAVSLSVDFGSNPFGFTDYRLYLQIWILFSDLLRIYLPVFAVLALIAYAKASKAGQGLQLGWKRYLPLIAAMAVSFLVAMAIVPLAFLSHSLFVYCAVLILVDLYESHVISKEYEILSLLPFCYLAMTVVSRLFIK